MKLSSPSGVLIQDVAGAQDIHPFMLSLWRKQVRDGMIVAKAAELKRLRELERKYKVLKEEHTLLKKHLACFGSKAELFAFIEANRKTHEVALMCRLYGVTRAGYYA